MKSSNFICTIGPTNKSVERIERMIWKGMSVARLNLSHGTLDEHETSIRNLRLASQRVEQRTKYFCPLGVAVDIRGPEIRTGKAEKTLVKLRGQLRLNDNPNFAELSSADLLHVDHPLAGKLKRHTKIFIGDGSIGMKVEEIFGDVITCQVTKSGTLTSFQSVDIPELRGQLNLPIVSERDRIALQFAVDQHVDFIFASHVESGEWIDEIRAKLGEAGKKIEVFAKIQNHFALEKIEEIIDKADGIVIAPTMDLSPQQIPYMQRLVLSLCGKRAKPCLLTVDSQLIGAEAYQAVNWLLELGDGAVITQEAAEGKLKPIESMTVLQHAQSLADEMATEEINPVEPSDVSRALAAACVTSSILTSAAVVVVSSEKLAHFVCSAHPKCQIVAVTKSKRKARQLNILNNLLPLYRGKASGSDLQLAIKLAKSKGLVKRGDTVILLNENQMQVHYVSYET